MPTVCKKQLPEPCSQQTLMIKNVTPLPQPEIKTQSSQTEEVFVFPLSFAQQRLWLLHQLDPHSTAYNLSQAVRLKGALNPLLLEQSLNLVAQRHEALRTTFSVVDEQPVQVISPALPMPLTVIDLGHMSQVEQQSEVQRWARQPFDLTQGPLLRVKLLRLAPAEHVLLITMHHIISDGWSMNNLLREIFTAYQAFLNNNSPTLPRLPIQYADYAIWQREWLQGDTLKTQLDYWKRQLNGAAPLLDLTLDYPRPATQDFRGARQRLTIPENIVEGLKLLCRQEEATLFMVLLAAFKTLLYRYTGQTDLIIGTPIANRNRSELEGLIGFFVNTLVLRSNLSGNPSFQNLVRRVRAVALDAYTHQDLPFEKLVEELQPPRSLSYNPLFQIMFILQNTPNQIPQLPNLAIQPVELEFVTAKFDLTLSITEENSALQGFIEYNTALFTKESITRITQHFQNLLQSVVANPKAPISQLNILTRAEQQQLLITWNDTHTNYPQNQCIHHLFETQAKHTPNAIALKYEDQLLTYQQLNSRANQLAHYLKNQGVGSETLVGICLERSIEMVIGLLGILKAGGAYLPLDPSYPKERLAYLLANSQAPVVLTRRQLVNKLPEVKANIICIDSDKECINRESYKNPITNVKSDNLAYVIYTSGSTGLPKGVLGTHKGALNRLTWMWKTYPFADKEICCQKTSLGFIDSLWEIFGPLLQGVPSVIIPDETLKDPYQFIKILETNNITRIGLVPSLLHVLLDSCHDLKARLSNLKIWISSGEILSEQLVVRFQTYMPNSILLNLYGMSEVSADSTWCDISQRKFLSRVPIGRPIANTQIYLLDAYLQPAPVGTPGELYIGGDGLARGYLNMPELTAQKFIPNPFSNQPGTRLYKTGDLARYLPDGNIEFIGRIDNQVKIRGVRVELEEIEAALKKHPAVQEAVVITQEDNQRNKRLIAYVVAHRQEAILDSNLYHYLKEKLPAYMLPVTFIPLDKIPLTPNGKTDRHALPTPDYTYSPTGTGYVPPRNPIEEILAGIWIKVLGISQVGIYDNFFELGGHSLLATQIITRIRNLFQVELPLQTLFDSPTIAELASALTRFSQEQPNRLEKIAQLLLQVTQLSEETIQAMLDKESKLHRQDEAL